VRRRIGYVGQGGSTAPDAKVGEELVDHAMLYGLSKAESTSRARALICQLDLEALWHRQIKTLSGGQRRRLDVAMGLINGAKLVVLDEPTTGLDPQARANLWEHVRRLRTELGATVFLTTHYLEEADALCDRILVIDHGEIVAAGSPTDLKERLYGDLITLTVADPARLADAARIAKGNGALDDPTTALAAVRFHVRNGAGVLPGLLRDLELDVIALAAVEVHRPTLDDAFLAITGRTLRDGPV
jgi:ABC-2 type transport system ATP-binding protein